MDEHAYRAFEIGDDGRVIARRDLISCFNDEDARQRAEQLVINGRAVELWDGQCLIERFEPSH
ncbi:hypothetical protein [Bradyrhizobium sp. sGM-13]|uniref:hypothetical protein n=1 Tax=Bradyrhizobium sp. sGM-13 TaxID=2831781 RepID=UPI001BCCB57A|nr:hypothetical protein [Bradyrhizobium sp. sGM-13]